MQVIKTAILLLLLATIIRVDLLYGQEIPEHYHPIRPNAMGGAFTAIANDEASVWTNPAGIARIRKARSRKTVSLIKFPNMVAGANGQSREFYQSMKSGQDAITANSEDIESDKPFWAMAGAFPMMMFDLGSVPMVLGGFSHLTTKAVIDKENPTQAATQIVWDTGPIVSFAWTNRTNRFNIGVQARSIARGAYEDFVPLTALVDQTEMNTRFKEKSNASNAIAIDAGLIWTLGDFWFPTVGIAILNAPSGCKSDYLNPFSKLREKVCGTVFTGQINNPDAISVIDPTDIRVGLSITPRISRKIGMRIAVDMHHIHFASGETNYGLNEIPILKTIHAGVELFTGNPLLPSPFSVSMGMSQGYYTMGGSIRLSFLSIDFATFGRDISTTETPHEDRRYMGGFSVDF